MFTLVFSTDLVDMNCLDEGRRHQTSGIERRCVYDVASKDSDGDHRSRISRAYAICRSSLQKSGRIKNGTAELTKLGSRRNASVVHKKDDAEKKSGFVGMLAKAREED